MLPTVSRVRAPRNRYKIIHLLGAPNDALTVLSNQPSEPEVVLRSTGLLEVATV